MPLSTCATLRPSASVSWGGPSWLRQDSWRLRLSCLGCWGDTEEPHGDHHWGHFLNISASIYISGKSSLLSQEEILVRKVTSYWNGLNANARHLELHSVSFSDLFIVSSFPFRTGESSYRACFSFHSSYSEVRGCPVRVALLPTQASLTASGSSLTDLLWLFLRKAGTVSQWMSRVY